MLTSCSTFLRKAALSAAFLAMSNFSMQAADHRDAPTADEEPQADITDIFAYVDPAKPTSTILQMNVDPFSNPNELSSYSFATTKLYQLKIDNVGDALAHKVVQFVFSGVRQLQTYKVYFGTPNEAGNATTNTVLPESDVICSGRVYYLAPNLPVNKDAQQVALATHTGSLGSTCFAGLRDDPFVTDVSQASFRIGLNPNPNAPTQSTHDQVLFRAIASPVLGPLTGHSVRADGTSGVDGFGGFDLLNMTIEIPSAQLLGSAGTKVGVWGTVSDPVIPATTPETYKQVERFGQTLTSTVFVFKAVPLNAVCADCAAAAFDADVKELYNEIGPDQDVARFGQVGPDALTVQGTPGENPLTVATFGPNNISARALLLTAGGFTAPPNGTPLLAATNTVNPANTANHNTDKDLFRKILFPDVIRLDTSVLPTVVLPGAAATANNDPVFYPIKGGNLNDTAHPFSSFPNVRYLNYGLQNGRRPADDVTDVLLRFAREFADVKFSSVVLSGAPSPLPGGGALGTRHALDCTNLLVPGAGVTLPGGLCNDSRIGAVLEGTDYIKLNPADISNLTDSGNDRALTSVFPYFADPHPLPSDAGTVGFPIQTDGIVP